MGAQALTNAIFLCEGLKLLILYCDVVVPAILLPGAFIIRLIPFTRKLGNTLISIAIAGYVLLPLSVIIVNELNKTIDVPEPEIDLSEFDGNNYAMGFANSLCGSKVVRTLLALGDLPFAMISCVFLLFIPGGQGAYWPCVLTMWNVVYPIIQIVFQLLFTSLNIIWEATISTGEEKYWLSAFDAVIPFLESVNNLVFLAYIDLIMIATITIVGARSFSSALGGEVYMFGIQRLI
jgi:hypothetical protein